MTGFYVVAALLLLVAFAILWFALGRKASADEQAQSRRETNVSIYRERLAELERDRDGGLIGAEELAAQKAELEHNLLVDVGDGAEEPPPSRTVGGGALLVAALVLVVLAVGLYTMLGGLQQWRLTETYEKLVHEQNGPDFREQLGTFAGRLASYTANHDAGADWWFLLAQTRMQLGEYASAAKAYGQLTQMVPDDPSLTAQQAQALYLANGRQITPQINALIDRSLAQNPHQATALGVRGIAAFEAGDFRTAIKAWQAALVGMPPNSANAKLLQRTIAEARKHLGDAAPEIAGNDSNAGTAKAAAGGTSITVSVSLGANVRPDDPNETVFVFARAAGGSPMPLAVARLTAADLPTDVELNDSMAMMPGRELGKFDSVEIVARLSAAGTPMPSPGDFEGSAGPLDPHKTKHVTIKIDHRVQ